MSLDKRASRLLSEGERVMTVCNACRYCEQYCPVFPAMEQRVTFGKADLVYLANLCHNCGECLYACQYAPPHEFGINVPQTLAEIRLRSYEEYCWPAFLGAAFRRNGVVTALLLAAAFSAVLFVAARTTNPVGFNQPSPAGDFYSVVPHAVMVSLFGAVGIYVLAALGIGLRRLRSAFAAIEPDRRFGATRAPASATWRAWRDVLTLRHLHTTGVDCTTDEEARSPWRRWYHHATFYGFMLCFASTSVAAVYHSLFGWIAPYGYTSLPVLLGTAGGLGLVIGPAGLLALRRRRDPALSAAGQQGLDESFIALLLVTSLTGLALLVLRTQAVMATLLVVHLGAVLALFVTLPYGKFVHGIYRAAALAKYAAELNPESQSPNPDDNRRGQTEANHHAGKDFRRHSETASE
jgi:citrate/tricarballylate utilization protein